MIPAFPGPHTPVVPMHPPVVGLCGLAGSGKSTAAAALVQVGYERVRFAGPLKAMMAALGLTEREIDGDLKEEPCALLGGRTPRHAMQTVGTEWGRQMIDNELWIRAWQRAAAGKSLVVVDDVRFENEAAAVRAAGGMLIRVMRPGLVAGTHASETAELACDVEVANTGSACDLRYEVYAALALYTVSAAITA